MSDLIPELRELGEHLEAECEGRPFDRRRAHALARRLAEHHPEIRATMYRVSERMASAG